MTQSRNPYTCPTLMWLQGLITPGSRWEVSRDGFRYLVCGHSRAACIFPLWMIRAELRLREAYVHFKYFLGFRWLRNPCMCEGLAIHEGKAVQVCYADIYRCWNCGGALSGRKWRQNRRQNN